MVNHSCNDSNDNFAAWIDINIQYKESYEKINSYIINKNAIDIDDTGKKVELEIAYGIRRDMTQMVRKTKQLSIYEYAALSQSDIVGANLTKRQREVALLRKCYSFEDIAKKLGISPKTAFATYKQAINKIEKCKKMTSLKMPIELSPQQIDIYTLYFIEGNKPAAIAKRLNISPVTIKEQLKRIKSKIKRGTNR